MGKTFLQLKTAVENRTGVNTETGRHINAGQLELARQSKRLKRANAAATDGVVAIPADCLIMRGVAWDSELLTIYPEAHTPDYGTGTPSWWQRDGNNINLLPKATGTAQLIYTPRPVEMVNDNDTPELADADDAIIAYAIWQIYVSGNDDAEAEFWEQKWLKEQVKWLQLDAQQHKQPRRVRAIRYCW